MSDSLGDESSFSPGSHGNLGRDRSRKKEGKRSETHIPRQRETIIEGKESLRGDVDRRGEGGYGITKLREKGSTSKIYPKETGRRNTGDLGGRHNTEPLPPNRRL